MLRSKRSCEYLLKLFGQANAELRFGKTGLGQAFLKNNDEVKGFIIKISLKKL
jgi:hypothetical protein